MWRALAVALLAANGLFLAWTLWLAPTPAGGGFRLPATASLPAPPPLPPRCVSLGPFADEAAAQTVLQHLAGLGLTATRRPERTSRRDGYWVVLGAADAAAQRRLLQQLRLAGVQDAYALPNDTAFRISLGIFSERERAEQRAGALRRLQLEPLVEEHLQEREVQWLDVPGAGDRISASRLESLGIADREVGAFDCPRH